jgi:hypothetical protein
LLGKSGGSARSGSAAFHLNLPVIERRVEDLRGLRFRHALVPLSVTGAQARRTGLAELDRLEPPSAQAADQELLKLLGLIPASANLRAIQGSILQDQVAGYYDTDHKRLAIVRGATGSSPAVTEITMAHELTHALEDQVYGIHDVSQGTSDRALAYTALVEGDATVIMTRYAQRFISGAGLLGAALSAGGAGSTAKLPEFIESSLEFPYLTGEEFTSALYQVAGGWKLVDYALARRPPVSTEQVMHPLKYEADEKPLPVRLNVGPLLPPGWRKAMSSTLGEFVTGELLQRGVGSAEASRAAAGWGGDAFQLWTSGSRAALVIAWRWDTPTDAAEFGRALRSVRFAAPAAVRRRAGATTLALAPSAALADVLAAQATAGS